MDDEKNKSLKEWYESGIDIREFIGIKRNPLHYIDLINNKFKVDMNDPTKEISPYHIYEVVDVTMEDDGTGSNKFLMYCELLANMVQNHQSVRLVDAPLAKKGSHEDQGAHWNSCRKNKFIVVER